MKLSTRFFMQKLLCLFICFILSTIIYGQNNHFQHKKDSLLKVIASTQGEEKLKAYEKLVKLQFSDEEVDLMLQHSTDFIREARKQQNKEYEDVACRAELSYLWNYLKHDEFKQKANKYLPFFKKNGFYKNYYTIYVYLLQLSDGNRDNKHMIEGAKQMYAEATQENCLFGITQATSLMARIYLSECRYEEGEIYYMETIENALKLIKEEPDQINNYHLAADGYNGLANALLFQKKINESFSLMPVWKKHSITYEKTFGHPAPLLINYYKFCANIYIVKERYAETELYCDSMELINPNPVILHHIWDIKANICESRNEYNNAIDWIDKLIDQGDNLGESSAIVHLLIRKARILSKMGQAEESFSVFKMAYERNNSIRQLKNNAQLDEIRTQYEVDKHIAEKKLEHSYFLSALGGCILLIVLLGSWVYYSRRIVKKNRSLYNQIKEQDRRKDELDILSKQHEQLIQSLSPAERERVISDKTEKFRGNNQQQQLVSYLHEYLLNDKTFTNSDIDVDKIVPELATNRTYLFDALKAVTGKTPMEYINFLRLEEARRLLECSDLTVENIFAECGFNSPQTFYRLFRDSYRITPSEYRKIAKTPE